MTPEQEKEFTAFNACAFDYARIKAQMTDTKIPCWLASSDDAKLRTRQDFLMYFNELQSFVVPITLECAERQLATMPNMALLVQQWKEREQELEHAREQGDPLAFFV